MFQIALSPQRSDDQLSLEVSGQTLIINGDEFQFASLPDGATIPRDDFPADCFITDDVQKIDGVIHVTVILPHGPNPSVEQAFPEPIAVSVDGPVTLPENEENGDLET